MPSRTSHVRFRPVPVVLEVVDHPQALLAVTERPTQERGERLLAQMAERRVPQVVSERDGLGQVLVQAERAGDGAGDVRDVERVRQPDPVVVALRRQEHLGLVLQPAERLGVGDAIAVALEDRADRVLRLVTLATLRLRGERGGAGERLRSICSVRSRGLAIALMLAPGGDRPDRRTRSYTVRRREVDGCVETRSAEHGGDGGGGAGVDAARVGVRERAAARATAATPEPADGSTGSTGSTGAIGRWRWLRHRVRRRRLDRQHGLAAVAAAS